MMKKGIGLIAFCILLCSIIFIASCSKKHKSTLDVVLERGIVRVGSGNNTPPMNYLDENGNWVGFDIDLADIIAERLGVKLERVVVNNSTRISFLTNSTVDIVLSNVSHTRSRNEMIDFAQPAYLWTGKIAYAKKGRFNNRFELAGKRIAVDQGSNAYTAIQQEIEKAGGKPPIIMTFPSNSECFLALKQDRVDTFVQDTVIIAAVSGKEGFDFEAVGGIFSPALFSIGVRQNDSKWKNKISFILQDLMRDGTYDKIYNKWFGPDGKYPMNISAKPTLPREVFGDNVFFTWPD